MRKYARFFASENQGNRREKIKVHRYTGVILHPPVGTRAVTYGRKLRFDGKSLSNPLFYIFFFTCPQSQVLSSRINSLQQKKKNQKKKIKPRVT